MTMIIATNIIADKPTALGNIYQKKALLEAINDFNRRAPVEGGLLDRQDVGKRGKVTHLCHRLFLNDSDVLCAEIEVLDQGLADQLNSNPLVARPVLSIPSYLFGGRPSKGHSIDDITRIVRIQAEVANEPERDKE